jgi:hypothetical protein
MKKVYSKNQIADLKSQILDIVKPCILNEFWGKHQIKICPKIRNTTILNYVVRLLGYDSFSELTAKYSHGNSNNPVFLSDLIDLNLEQLNFHANKLNLEIKGEHSTNGIKFFVDGVICAINFHCLKEFAKLSYKNTERNDLPYCAQLLSYESENSIFKINDSNEVAIYYYDAHTEDLNFNKTPYFKTIEDLETHIKENILKYRKTFKLDLYTY